MNSHPQTPPLQSSSKYDLCGKFSALGSSSEGKKHWFHFGLLGWHLIGYGPTNFDFKVAHLLQWPDLKTPYSGCLECRLRDLRFDGWELKVR